MNPSAQNLRNKLKLRHLDAQKSFGKNHPHARAFFENAGLDLGKVRAHAGKLLAAGTLGTLLLAPPKTYAQALPLPEPLVRALTDSGAALPKDPKNWLIERLQQILPPINNAWGLPFLTHEEEKAVGKIIERSTGVAARATLEGEHLNTTYGYIGAEQHLPRFPGDTVLQHDEFQESGITPARGAWGYFAPSRAQMTEQDILREKYYVAVQTLYLPDWDRRWKYLKDWYKWRKVIVVDVPTGNAVVAVVGDAGPAAWTGKHFGGSPEVMNVLGGPRYKKGRALLFFVDDPENKIPLGPVDYTKLEVPVVKSI